MPEARGIREPKAPPWRRGDGAAGPGVPEALPRALEALGQRLGVGTLDRIWIFPPLVRGRREWGLAAASAYVEGERRRLVTTVYSAEQTGKGVVFDVSVVEEGEAPVGRLGRIMRGVVRRSGIFLGDPREVAIEGQPEAFRRLVSGLCELRVEEGEGENQR